MLKKLTSVAVLIFILMACLSPLPVQADGGLAVLGTSVQVDFPGRIDFYISVESGSDINDIRLHYRVNRLELASVTTEILVNVAPSPKMVASWTWDMRKTGGLPPGSSLEYWWTVSDVAGNNIVTTLSQVPIEDTRYNWRTITEDKVTLLWYEGDEDFAGKLMTAAQQTLSRLSEYAGAELSEDVSLYIYADSQDLQGSMIYPQEWTGGVAFTRYGIIAIGISPDNLEWGTRAIAHELTHLVVHQVTFNTYGGLPTWLDEGLAMYSEGNMQSWLATVFKAAAADNSLISVRSLASPFSAYAAESSLAYAQSYSIVEYLISQYGQEKMFELLNTFREGSDYDGALNAVYGFDMDRLNELWREHIMESYFAEQPEEELSPVIIIVAAVSAAVVLFFIGFVIWERLRKGKG